MVMERHAQIQEVLGSIAVCDSWAFFLVYELDKRPCTSHLLIEACNVQACVITYNWYMYPT